MQKKSVSKGLLDNLPAVSFLDFHTREPKFRANGIAFDEIDHAI